MPAACILQIKSLNFVLPFEEVYPIIDLVTLVVEKIDKLLRCFIVMLQQLLPGCQNRVNNGMAILKAC